MTTADPLELEEFLARGRIECLEKLNQTKSIQQPGTHRYSYFYCHFF